MLQTTLHMEIWRLRWNRQISQKVQTNTNHPVWSSNLSSPITIKGIEFVSKNFAKKKSSGAQGFTGGFYQTLKEELTRVLHKRFQKIDEGTLIKSFHKAVITLIPIPEKDSAKIEIDCRPLSLINKMQNPKTYYQTELSNTWKELYTITKLGSFQGCKIGSVF